MAYKQINITVPDWIFSEYLEGIQGNRSAFIVEMFVRGIKSEIGETENNSAKLVTMLKELRNKDDEIKKLQLLIGSLKKKLGTEEDQDRREKERFADAWKANNPLRDMED